MEFPTTTPILTDGTVTLRAHDSEDLDDMVVQGQDPRMRRWTNVPSPYRRQDAEGFLRICHQGWIDGNPLNWAIEVDSRFAGTIGFRMMNPFTAGVGYSLAPWARGHGFTSRALRLILPWGFDRLDLRVIRWGALVGNWASRKIAWRAGFRIEGRSPGLMLQRGEPVDLWTGSLTAGDPGKPETAWYVPPTIDDGHIRLRSHRPQDRLRMTEAARDPVTQTWLPKLPTDYTLRDAQHHLDEIAEKQARGQGMFWAVTEIGSDAMIAEISLYIAQRAGSGELGYWTHPTARGAGATGRAVRLAARYALRPDSSGGLGLRRLVIRAAERNTASIRVALRAGFRLVGTDRAAEVLRDGTVTGLHRFDLLAGEEPAPDPPEGR
jgi:RimJ/RimL family protein N-acetyltransferase